MVGIIFDCLSCIYVLTFTTQLPFQRYYKKSATLFVCKESHVSFVPLCGAFSDLSHDFELELRMLKKYGYIYNFPEVLVKYRIHENQVTFKGGKSGTSFWNNIRKKIIDDFIT